MLVRITRNYTYEGKPNDLDYSVSVREMGDKSLLDSIEIEPTGEQEFVILKNDLEVTKFNSKDYEQDNVDLTLKMLKSKVLKIEKNENYFKVRGTRKNNKGDDVSCFFDNFISSVVKIVIE